MVVVSDGVLLLDGRRATTHWPACGELAARYPGIDVYADAGTARDGPLIISAGVTAGSDMALALVEEDRGAELARDRPNTSLYSCAGVEAAQALLESSTDSGATIARHCGFGSEETMRRIYYAAVVGETGCGATGFIVIAVDSVGSCRTSNWSRTSWRHHCAITACAASFSGAPSPSRPVCVAARTTTKN